MTSSELKSDLNKAEIIVAEKSVTESDTDCATWEQYPFSAPSYNPLTEYGDHYRRIFELDLWPRVSTFDVQELKGRSVGTLFPPCLSTPKISSKYPHSKSILTPIHQVQRRVCGQQQLDDLLLVRTPIVLLVAS